MLMREASGDSINRSIPQTKKMKLPHHHRGLVISGKPLRLMVDVECVFDKPNHTTALITQSETNIEEAGGERSTTEGLVASFPANLSRR